ncbi:MAG: holo-[acyl-carrier-protein] synthase [Phycisphaerae bacterium]|nr:holo-[acyl-carrier-protein] synthase [Phycisphaerae bacterium]
MDDHVHPSLKGQRGSGPGPVDPRYGHRSDRPAANNPPVSIVGHGVDIVAVERIGRMVAEHGERFLSRVFTAKERAYAQGKARGAEHLAARFAAKEAAFKALGTGWRDGIAWTDVGVEHDAMGRPMLVVRGRAAEVARARGVARWWVTLSHTAGTAVASVIAEGA